MLSASMAGNTAQMIGAPGLRSTPLLKGSREVLGLGVLNSGLVLPRLGAQWSLEGLLCAPKTGSTNQWTGAPEAGGLLGASSCRTT